MPQLARPTADVTKGSWSDQAAGTTNLYATLADDLDSTYVKSLESADTDVLVYQLGSVSDPGVDTGHVLNYRYDKSVDGGAQIDLVTQLRQGYVNESSLGTLINEETITDIPGTAIVNGALSITNASAITNYGSLYVRHIKTLAVVVGELLFTSISTLADSVDRSSYTVPAPASGPVGNRLLVLMFNVTQGSSTDPTTPSSVTGMTLTWTRKTITGNDSWGATPGTTHKKWFVYVTKTSGSPPAAGAITIDFGGVTHTGLHADLISVAGADLSGAATAAIVQAVGDFETNTTSGDVTLAAAGDPDNRVLAGVAWNNSNPTPSIGGSYTQLNQLTSGAGSPAITFISTYRGDAFTTSLSWSSVSSTQSGGVAMEIKAA